MKVILSILTIVMMLIYLAVTVGCGGAVKEPEIEPVPKEPTIEELRKPVAKDPTIYKAAHVLQNSGRLTKKYMSYEKYRQLTGGKETGALDPDWFYDSYQLDLIEEGYWAMVTFGTAERAIERDPRIEKLMTDLPGKSIVVKLQTPSGKRYLLSDAEADGILDFAKEENKKTDTKIDIELLDKMQEKYNWIIGLIKKYYKK